MTTPTHTQPLSELGIRALAALVHELRPDWDSAGVAANLRAVASNTHGPALALAAIRGSQDQANRTPAFIRHPNNRAWTGDWCPTHGNTPRRTDGECAACFTERVAAPTPENPRRTTSRPHPLEDALARVPRPGLTTDQPDATADAAPQDGHA